jgi:hypothetical protein
VDLRSYTKVYFNLFFTTSPPFITNFNRYSPPFCPSILGPIQASATASIKKWAAIDG